MIINQNVSTAEAGAKVASGSKSFSTTTSTFRISCDFNPTKIIAVNIQTGNPSSRAISIYTDSNSNVYCMYHTGSLQMASTSITKSYSNGEITLTYNNGFATGDWLYILTE